MLPVTAGVSASGGGAGLAGTTGLAAGLITGLGASGRSLAQSFLPGLAISGIATGVTVQVYCNSVELICAAYSLEQERVLPQ